jgi:hypothetical protein
MRCTQFLGFIFCVLFWVNQGRTQDFYDNNWILGYDSSLIDPTGNVIQLNFMNNALQVQGVVSEPLFWMVGTNASVSDKNGKLALYTNGCKIINANHSLMENGDTLTSQGLYNGYCDNGGVWFIQGAIALPDLTNTGIYRVFTLNYEFVYFDTMSISRTPTQVYASKVEITAAKPLGVVTEKKLVVAQDTFARGGLSATRHSNGTDWWLVIPKSHSNCYFSMRVNSDGVQPAQKNCAGTVWSDIDSGQNTFSPDGTKYVRYNESNGLQVFDFNAASGVLTNARSITIPIDNISFYSGVAISPNSRYLYVPALLKVYQYDLDAADISASRITVAEYDGFMNPYPTIFYLAASAPDGKIYIASGSSHKNLHVIHKPDCPGLKCELQQHGITLPTYNCASIPNLPHYRSMPTQVNCDSIYVALHEPAPEGEVIAYPNPTQQSVWLDLSSVKGTSNWVHIRAVDTNGRLAFEKKTQEVSPTLDLSGLSNGVYFLLISTDRKSYRSKIVKF